MIVSGKVTKLVSKPTRGASIQPPGDPLPPAILLADIDADDWALLLAAYTKGSDVDVQTGPNGPPNCAGVTAK